jgi:hypothetical protein
VSRREKQAPADRKPRIRWEAVAGITAVVSLAAALVFNGIQVRENGQQARAAREATELQLLTQLNTVVNNSTEDVAGVVDRRRAGALSAREHAVLVHALGDFDYVAWLFENNFLTLPAAKGYWGGSLRCAYARAKLLIADAELRPQFPSLARYGSKCP